MIAAARRTPGIMSDQAPFVLQTALNDFYVSYELNTYTAEANRIAAIYSGLHANIQDAFNQGGVEINSPHYRAIRDGNQTTIPASYPLLSIDPRHSVRTRRAADGEKPD